MQSAVIFGAGGQLGVELKRELLARDYQVHTFARTQIDITNQAVVEDCIAKTSPTIVFNSAAYNQVDIAEQEPVGAFQVNALAVRNIALACRQADAKLVHFSTDYVFDGQANRPYVETDPTHPLGAYGVSKLAGEFYAQAYLDNALIVRTCGVFGPGGAHTARGNFVETMLRLERAGKPINVVEDFIASPTYAPALANRTIELALKQASGIFHIGGGFPISWYDFARLIFEASGLSPTLQPVNERTYRTLARRPKFSVLSNEKMESLGIEPMPSLKGALADYVSKAGQ